MVPCGTAPTIIWVARWWGLPRSTPAVAGGTRLYGPFIATQDPRGPFSHPSDRSAPPCGGHQLSAATAARRRQPSPDFPLAKNAGRAPGFSPAAIHRARVFTRTRDPLMDSISKCIMPQPIQGCQGKPRGRCPNVYRHGTHGAPLDPAPSSDVFPRTLDVGTTHQSWCRRWSTW